MPEPFVDIHPNDAEIAGITDGAVARVETAQGSGVFRARVVGDVLPGTIFVPIHWSRANSSAAGAGCLVHKECDPVSGQPDLKGTPARVHACTARFYAYVVSRARLHEIEASRIVQYWSRATIEGGYGYALALYADFADAKNFILSVVGRHPMTFEDPAGGRFRAASLHQGRIELLVCLAAVPHEVAPGWMRATLTQSVQAPNERRTLLAGGEVAGLDTGSLVCVCHQVGSQRIRDAIAAGCRDVASVGAACGAGTTCGSCIPEVLRLCETAREACTSDTVRHDVTDSECSTNGQADRSNLKCADPVTG